MANGRRATIHIDVEAQDAREELRRLGKDFDGFSRATIADVRAVDDAFGGLDSRLVNTRRGFSSASNQAFNFNEIIFNTGDLIQDAQFGIRGAANNVGLLAEQFSVAATRSGGFGAALRGAGAALLGTGGIVLGIQAALVVLPDLINRFSGVSDAADEMRDAIREAADAIVDMDAEIEDVRFDEADLVPASQENQQQLQALRTELETLERPQERIEEINRRIADLTPAITKENQRLVQQLRNERAVMQDDVALYEERVRQVQNEIEHREALQEGLDREIQAMRAQVDRRRIAVDLGARRIEQGKEEADNEKESADETERRLNALQQVNAIQEQINRRFLQGAGRPDLVAEGQQMSLLSMIFGTTRGAAAPSPLEQVQQQLQRESQFGLLANDAMRAQREVQLLNQALQQLAQDPDIDPESMGVQDLINALMQAREETEETGQVAQQLGSTAVLAGANALAGVFERGANAAERMQNAASGLLRTLGNQFIRLAFEGGVLGLPGGATGILGVGATLLSGAFQHGTDFFPGGVGLVGERGPELAVLPRGTQIHSNRDTQRLFRDRESAQGRQIEALRMEMRALAERPVQIIQDPFASAEGLSRYDAISATQ